MNEDDRYTRITLRMPRDLHEQLSASAEESSKSMNAEIIARLRKSFEADGTIAAVAADIKQAQSDLLEISRLILQAQKNAK